MQIKVTYRVVHFIKPYKWVAMAWNYDHAIIYATPPADSYKVAMENLQKLAEVSKTQLSYFDGEFNCAGEGEQLIPIV
jgi:hypothetical protein